jgi:anti-anti-sigma factor
MELLRIYQTDPRGFRLVGELDLSCLDQLRPIEDKVSQGGDLHLDLSRLTFMDGAGLERLSEVARGLRARGCRLVVLRPHKSIERLLKRMISVDKVENVVISRLSSVVKDSFETPDVPRDLDHVMVSDYAPEAACRLVCELAVAEVTGAEAAALTVNNAGHAMCVASSDSLSESVGALEVQLGEGPSVDSLRTGRRHFSHTLVSERRWPQLVNRALYSGIASVLAEPLPAHGTTFGVLTLYSSHENAFDECSFLQAASVASRGGVVIANSNLYWQATELADQLKEALESRAVIDQAKGVLIAREGISPEEAFSMLLKASQSGNIKVRDIAVRLVEDAQDVRSRDIVA